MKLINDQLAGAHALRFDRQPCHSTKHATTDGMLLLDLLYALPRPHSTPLARMQLQLLTMCQAVHHYCADSDHDSEPISMMNHAAWEA